VLSPCYETLDRALEQAHLVVRSWTLGEPQDFKVQAMHEENPFAFVLTSYWAPRGPESSTASWMAALVLRRQVCGWIWVSGAISDGEDLLDQHLGDVSYHLSFQSDWRYWMAMGRCSPSAHEVRCRFDHGPETSVRPSSDGWFLIGGPLRGPRELLIFASGNRLVNTVPMPQAFRQEIAPLHGFPAADFEVEKSSTLDLEAEEP
jgi:hypothetical protein